VVRERASAARGARPYPDGVTVTASQSDQSQRALQAARTPSTMLTSGASEREPPPRGRPAPAPQPRTR
jgi:hypothetical protein